MGNLSSINFKKSNAINTQHNDRTLPPSYLQVKEGGFEVNRSFEEAQALKEKIISEAIQKYTELTNQKFQGKSYEWSAVVNIKEDSTMQDLERLASYFQENYGFQCYQIAIHRDEGHIDENGKLKINHHAHLEFVMLDKDTGKTCFKMRDFTIKKMRELQTEVARELKMERGVDKRISKTKRIEPRAYAKMKEREKEIKQEIKQAKLNRKALIKEYTEQMKGKGFKQTDFQAMRGIANDEELESEEKIREQIKKFLEDIVKERQELALESKKHSEAMLEVNKEIETLKIENESLKNEIEDLKSKESEVFSVVTEKEVVVMPSFEEIKKSLTYEQKQEIAEPFAKVYKGMQKNAEEQRDRYYEENRELIIERKTYYETRGWKDIDFNQELAKERTKSQRLEEKLKEAQNQQIQVKEVVKEVPRPLTEEQKQEIIAPYKEKITLLEGIIQKFHNFLVKLGYKAKDSNAHEVPTLQEPKNENRMCPQVKAEMEKRAQKQGRGR